MEISSNEWWKKNHDYADDPFTILVQEGVWGGVQANSFGRIKTVPIDPILLDDHSEIYIKTSVAGEAVGIGNIFAEVYYE